MGVQGGDKAVIPQNELHILGGDFFIRQQGLAELVPNDFIGQVPKRLLALEGGGFAQRLHCPLQRLLG